MSDRLPGWLLIGVGAAVLLVSSGRVSSLLRVDAAPQAPSDTRTAPPPLPYVEYDVCPFECCTYRDWKASRSITVYERWRDPRNAERSKVAFAIQRGETVTAMTGLVMTTKAGRARVPKDGVLEVVPRRFIGRPPEKLPIRVGDIIYLLTPHSEHTYTAWFGGNLLEQIVPVVDPPAAGSTASAPATATSGPVAANGVPPASGASSSAPAAAAVVSTGDQPLEWWIRVRNEQGEVGWTDRARDFSGADGCRTALPSRGMR
jgi:hypothetical protein